jgi:hypothetical protein
VWLPAPTAAASFWQCASAPARPPKSAPLPEAVLVTKNVIADALPPALVVASGECIMSAHPALASAIAIATAMLERLIASSLSVVGFGVLQKR